MSAAKSLSNALQAIVDNRLDAIDQNLLRAGIPRHQRRSIVEEVENQILEMLTRLEHEELTRQDVLAVLARLDPPEAYVPEDAPGRPVAESPPATTAATSAARTAVQSSVAAASQLVHSVNLRWQSAWLAFFAAGLCLFTLFLGICFVFSGIVQETEVGLLFLMLLAGVATLLGAFSLYHLRREPEQRFALAAALLATLLFPVLILNGLLALISTLTYPVIAVTLILAAFLAMNVAIGRYAWRWARKRPAPRNEAAASSAPLVISA